MSVSDEEPYSTIFASLNHPVRRRILRMLSQKPMSFSEILEVLGVSSSFLTYHIENLRELVSKANDGKYGLSSFGEAAMATMSKVEDIPITAPQQQTRSRKFAARSVAIVLGIVCILLVASLGVAIAYYTMTIHDKGNELNSANSTINQLNETIADQNNTINQLSTNVTILQNQIASANASLAELLRIFDLNESTTVLTNCLVVLGWSNSSIPIVVNSTVVASGFNDTTGVFTNQSLARVPIDYAGYLVVNITTNEGNNTFVEVEYSANGLDYHNIVNVGSGGLAYFPVLPTSTLKVLVGHTDTLPQIPFQATIPVFLIPQARVTITYYY